MRGIFGCRRSFFFLICVSAACSGGIDGSYRPSSTNERGPRVAIEKRFHPAFSLPYTVPSCVSTAQGAIGRQQICLLSDARDSLQKYSCSHKGTCRLARNLYEMLGKRAQQDGAWRSGYGTRDSTTRLHASTISGTFTVSARAPKQFAPHPFLASFAFHRTLCNWEDNCLNMSCTPNQQP